MSGGKITLNGGKNGLVVVGADQCGQKSLGGGGGYCNDVSNLVISWRLLTPFYLCMFDS